MNFSRSHKVRKRIKNEVPSSALSTNLIFRCHPFFSWYYGHSSSYFTDGHLLLQAYTTWSILEIQHKILRLGQSTHSQCRGHFWALCHHCLLETTSLNAVHPELQVRFIGNFCHSLFPPATPLFPLWRKKKGSGWEKKTMVQEPRDQWWNLWVQYFRVRFYQLSIPPDRICPQIYIIYLKGHSSI